MGVIKYFGTSLREHGHYFWLLDNHRMDKIKTDLKELDFDPYNGQRHSPKGTVDYIATDKFSAIVITGSCTDHRGGTVSTFFVEKPATKEELKELIMSVPIAQNIINQMKFEVKW